uniref:Leucine-rich repeat-containing N-terminal plant-type domain-containing protein n=1 Tax=Oryza glumipatula TaxID=40148 RepID=A0A0E0BSP7_9ORYZ
MLPQEFCQLVLLNFLDLSSNQIYGDLPTCWSNLQQLFFLDLSSNAFSGKVPTSTSKSLPICKNLTMVDLRDNRLSAEISSRIWESLPSLKILQFNQHTAHFANFRSMMQQNKRLNIGSTYVAFTYSNYFLSPYSNRIELIWKSRSYTFESTIPLLAIPAEFANLKGLQFLKLSRNNISGSIPNDIGNMNALESLDLSCNAFSGRAPTGGQLETLNDPSIYSNDYGLCGTVLSACPIESSRFGSEPNKDEFRSLLSHNHRGCYWILAMVELS